MLLDRSVTYVPGLYPPASNPSLRKASTKRFAEVFCHRGEPRLVTRSGTGLSAGVFYAARAEPEVARSANSNVCVGGG